MMPELGDYAREVLTAYGVSIGLLAVICLLSWRRSRAIRAKLDQVEARRKTQA